MNTLCPRPLKVEIDVTAAQLTGFGSWSMPGQMPEHLGRVGQAARAGASDAKTLWSLIASLAASNGAPSDLDKLCEDRVDQRLLGLRHVSSGRRPGEHPARIDEAQLGTLLAVAPAVVEHEVAVRGDVPVFVDGTATEVDGRLFEETRSGYDGARQVLAARCVHRRAVDERAAASGRRRRG